MARACPEARSKSRGDFFPSRTVSTHARFAPTAKTSARLRRNPLTVQDKGTAIQQPAHYVATGQVHHHQVAGLQRHNLSFAVIDAGGDLTTSTRKSHHQ